MFEKYKILAQANPVAGVETNLFTAPASQNGKINGITVCNRAAADTTFRVAFIPRGVATAAQHYVYYNLPITANNTFMATFEMTMLSSDVVRVYTAGGNLTFILYGQLQ